MARRFLVPRGGIMGIRVWLLIISVSLAQQAPAQDEAAKEPSSTEAAGEEGASSAQEASPAAPTEEREEGAAATAESRFQAKFAQWKEVIQHLRELRAEWETAADADRPAQKKEWDATVAKGERILPDLVDSAIAAYQAAPNEDRKKTRLLAKALNDYVARDRYQPALEIAHVLVENDCDLPVDEVTQVYRNAGIAAFAMNQYQRMEEFLAKAQEKNVVGGNSIQKLQADLDNYQEAWEREKERRAKEAQANDLPRVKLETTEGDIVVELFENEAPDTVGNFVYLVKRDFYDGLTFHDVRSGFMAQTGCPHGDGTGGPGYTIYDEFNKPEARKHFRGVLSMANRNVPDSGDSQFFITYRPAPHLDGRHTVFGRVIEGMDVITRLQRRSPQDPQPPEPDRILEAEVLRDRGHEYLPNKVQ